MADELLARARAVWERLAGAPVAFGHAGGVAIAVAPASRLGPPGWVGIVALGDGALATAPTPAQAVRLGAAVARLDARRVVDPAALTAALPVAGVLGPATLAYLASDAFRAWPSESVETLRSGGVAVAEFVAGVDPADADESGIARVTSPVFCVRLGGAVAAAAGYQEWDQVVAHLSVLTAAGARGRGLARTAASAAIAHALARGLLPQWRARPPASRRVAGALGFEELGAQLCVRLDE